MNEPSEEIIKEIDWVCSDEEVSEWSVREEEGRNAIVMGEFNSCVPAIQIISSPVRSFRDDETL